MQKNDIDRHRSGWYILIFWGMVLLTAFEWGCATNKQAAILPLEPPDSFSASGMDTVPDRWWEAFGDPELNRLIDSVLKRNFNLQTTWSRLLEARAIADRASSALFPLVEGSSQAGKSFPEPDYVGGENFRVAMMVEYEIDLWGRVRSEVEAERYRSEAARADYEAAAITLSAEIVRIWFNLAESYQQLRLVQGQMRTNSDILALLRTRFGTGLIRSVDILRQQQLLEATREQSIAVESRIGVLENQLAVLLGRSPKQDTGFNPGDMPELPPIPDTGIPSDLIQRRPDIQGAYKRLLAADRQLAAAISNKYPRISISASTSFRSNDYGNLLKDWAYSFAGNLVAPIFYWGELRAEVDRTEAIKQRLLYAYGQAVLVAFREVEDALLLENRQREQQRALEAQVGLARQAYEQLRVGYLNGSTGYLDVLTALSEEQQIRREVLRADLSVLEHRILLYRALAGGFEAPGKYND